MPPKKTPAEAQHVVDLYLAGCSGKDIAKRLGFGQVTIYRILREAGVTRTSGETQRGRVSPKRLDLPDADIVGAYLAGESPSMIARRYGCSQQPIRRILEAANVVRSRADASRARWLRPGQRKKTSEANKRVWARRSKAQRAAQVEAAHRASRGSTRSLSAKIKRAVTKERLGRYDSELERLFETMCRDRGLVFERRQAAIGPYNADFAIGRITVEVSGHGRGPDYWPLFEERARYLFDRGWSILMFHFTTRRWILTPKVADYAVSLIEQLRRNPPSPCEYRVIWGAGERVTTRCADEDDLAFVPPTRNVRDPATGRYKSVPRET